MAALQRNLELFDDLVVKDAVHRHQLQTAANPNTIQKLYSLGSNAQNISAATLVGVNAWSLRISTNTSKISLNAISATGSSISANSVGTFLSTAQLQGNLTLMNMCRTAAGRFGAVNLNGAATGAGISTAISNNSPLLVTSAAVFNALPGSSNSSADFPTITTLGTLLDLEVREDVVAGSETLRVQVPQKTVRMDATETEALPYSITFPWVSRTGSISREWKNIGFGNGFFCAVGGASGGIMTSPNGTTWTTRAASITTEFRSVCYGGGRWVAVADATSYATAQVATSVDGITWTTATISARNAWNSVVWGNGLFVAVAWTGEGNRIMTSTNGTTWVVRESPADNSWQSVTFGQNLFVAVADNDDDFDPRRVMTSSDGVNWEMQESADDTAAWNSITYGNSLFVAVAHNQIMTSPDGVSWTLRDSPANNPWWSVSFGNSLFVAVSWAGTGGRAMWSPDGIVWTQVLTSDETSGWYSVAFGLHRFVSVAISGPIRVMSWDVTPDGSPGSFSSSALLNVTGNVSVGNSMQTGPLRAFGELRSGNVSVKDDGISWISGNASMSNISSSNAVVTFDAGSYTHVGSTSSGRMRQSSYVRSPALPIGAQSRREYAMSRRFWSGKVLKTSGSYVLICHGNGAYPLYGRYTVQYMTKAGTFDCEMASCFRGSVAQPGNFGSLTWTSMASASSNTGLSAVLGSSTWLPTITFTNTTPYHAYFQVHAEVFDESFAFSESGV